MDNGDGGKGHEPGVDETAENAEILRCLAEKLRKRKTAPLPPELRASAAECEGAVRGIMPPEAGVTSITCDAARGEVTITATRPGLAIGRLGTHLNAIREATGWKPIIVRALPKDSSEYHP